MWACPVAALLVKKVGERPLAISDLLRSCRKQLEKTERTDSEMSTCVQIRSSSYKSQTETEHHSEYFLYHLKCFVVNILPYLSPLSQMCCSLATSRSLPLSYLWLLHISYFQCSFGCNSSPVFFSFPLQLCLRLRLPASPWLTLSRPSKSSFLFLVLVDLDV